MSTQAKAITQAPTTPPPPLPPPTTPPPTTPTTTPTTITTMTTIVSSAFHVTTENSNACVLASTLSATVVILFLLIALGVIYFLWKRKRGESIPKLPLKTGQPADLSCNQAFQSDEEYNVPPHREEPIPRKKHIKQKDNQPVSPYHKPLAPQDDYSVPPPTRPDTSIKPPLPPNMVRKMQQNNENGAATNHDEIGNAYYLDMDGSNNGLYQNINTSQDNIYINN